jgi:hypothetical protein
MPNDQQIAEAMSNTGIVTPYEALALIAAQRAMGLVLVPAEPTEAMEVAAMDAMKALGGTVYGEDPIVCWRAMIAAAQDGEP